MVPQLYLVILIGKGAVHMRYRCQYRIVPAIVVKVIPIHHAMRFLIGTFISIKDFEMPPVSFLPPNSARTMDR